MYGLILLEVSDRKLILNHKNSGFYICLFLHLWGQLSPLVLNLRQYHQHVGFLVLNNNQSLN